ncbi:hypothetical protein [Cetobacterium sp.]|uniref:hypothetical protein n=1 Tax=Cetobacterium sp. TaxID=2071632 RepID=UPI003EE7B867
MWYNILKKGCDTMGQYLETGIILKISTKSTLVESLEKGYIKRNYRDIIPEMFDEIKNEEKGTYEYYPKYINIKELEETKLNFLQDYNTNPNDYSNQKGEIIEFFSNVKADTSEELFREIENFDKYGMVIDKEGMYLGYTVYKLRLSLDGKMYMECSDEFIAFFEKIIRERYKSGYSKYIKVSLE